MLSSDSTISRGAIAGLKDSRLFDVRIVRWLTRKNRYQMLRVRHLQFSYLVSFILQAETISKLMDRCTNDNAASMEHVSQRLVVSKPIQPYAKPDPGIY